MNHDPQTQSPEQREAELRAAGWLAWDVWTYDDDYRMNDTVSSSWQAPDGRLFADAYGAWCVMRQERDNRC